MNVCICCARADSVAHQLGVNVRGLGGGSLNAWLCDDCDRAIRAAPREPGEAERLARALDHAQDEFGNLTGRQQRERFGDGVGHQWVRLSLDYFHALAELALPYLAAPRPGAGDGTGEPT